MENPLADIERIRNIEDPAERGAEIGKILNALPTIAAELKAMRQAAGQELRARGWTYQQIGDAWELHRNRAQQVVEGRSGGGKGGRRAAEQEADRG